MPHPSLSDDTAPQRARDVMMDAAAGPIVAQFAAGARAAAGGVYFTLKHPRLLAWAFVPMIVHAALFVLLVWLGADHVDALAERFGPNTASPFAFVRSLVVFLLFGGLVLGSIVASLLFGSVVCDPIYDMLSEATESVVVGHPVGVPFDVVEALRGIAAALSSTVVRFTVYLAVAVPLWILGLTGVGSVLSVPGLLAWNCVFIAHSALERAMGRHGLAGWARIRATFTKPACTLGFGAMGWVLATIPLTMPFVVVAGTRLYLALAIWDHVGSRLTDADKRALRKPGA